MLPFLLPEGKLPFENGDCIFIPQIATAIKEKKNEIKAYVVKNEELQEFSMQLGDLTEEEREIILKGCLINYNNKTL